MSYLARIAARASAAPASAQAGVRLQAGETQPSLTSQSPLVRFDQRLSLPGFAELGLGTAGGETNPSDGLTAMDGEAATPALGESAVGRTPEALLSSSPAVVSAPGAATSVATTATLTPLDGAPPPLRSSDESDRATTAPLLPAALAVARERAVPQATVPTSLTAIAVEAPSAETPSTRTATARLAPAEPSRLRAAANAPVLEERAEAVEKPGATAVAGPHAVLDAVARLDAWLRADASPAAPVTPVAAAFAAVPEALASAETMPAPTITIGKLEVEVVPPAPLARWSAPNPAPERRARPVRRAPEPMPAAARAFGWRQR
jgi:hypothetical protein